MIKKMSLLLAVCLVVLAMSTTAFAGQITITPDVSDQTLITVTGTGFTAGDQIGIIALKPNVTLDNINQNDPIQSIDYIDQREGEGENGAFEFTYKSSGEPGTYNVYYTGSTETPVTYSIVVQGEEDGTISGKIVSSSGSVNKSDDVVIKVINSDDTEVASVNANADGTFTITDLAPDTYSVVFTKTGHLSLTINGVTVSENQDSALGDKELIAGDSTNDGAVGPDDLLYVLNNYYKAISEPGIVAGADADNDGAIGPADLLCILNNYYAVDVEENY